MREPGIYFIINLDNGKVYVGQTVSLKTRLSGHFTLLRKGRHSNRHLQFAFNMDGEDSFYPYLAERCHIDDLTNREQHWIDLFGPDRCYNIAPAGGSCLGVKHTEETKRKVSAANKGRKQPPHVADAVRRSNATRQIKPETRAKLALALKKRVITDETRKKLSLANLGRPLSEEQKRKLSDAKSKRLFAFGKTQTIKEWSEETGIPSTTISKRLVYGWTIEESVSRPKRGFARYLEQIEADGASLGVLFSAGPHGD